jgi:ABC-type multidrug transport system fused ATPase/permease subunit
MGVTITIKYGEKSGIVGSTGSGKTTFADLLLGLLQPDHGKMMVDGELINSINCQSWMQRVGYVPQNIFLKDASVLENIALTSSEAEIDVQRVYECAKIAQIDQYIRSSLPEGYQTYIGERGVRLSGGQRQRLGIARALYNGADLIIFDEATSALDTLTEAEVMGAIDALPDDKTVIMIAHRLSTVRKSDRIIVLERGQVAGFGSWEDLKKNNVVFQRLIDA